MNLRVAASLAPPRMLRAAPVATAATTLQALERLRGEWQALERRSSQAALFQSADWCLHAARHLAEREGARFRPLVVTVRAGGDLVALAPLRIDRLGPVRLAVDIAAPFGQYGDILVADGADAEAVVAAVVATLRAHGVDGLALRRVRADSPVAAALAGRGFAVGEPDAAPWVDFRPHADFAGYLKTVNGKTRKNLRNLHNRLARSARLEHRVHDGDGLAEVVEQAFDSRLRMLEEQGLTSTAFLDGGFRAFLHRLAAAPDGERPDMLAMALTADGAPISMHWGFVHRGRYYAYLAARDFAYDEMSPGRVHLETVLHALHDRGIAVADLLAPAVRYKFTWTEQAMAVGDVAVPLTLAGRAWLELWQRRLRPWARRRYLALPTAWRQRLQRLVNPAAAAGAQQK